MLEKHKKKKKKKYNLDEKGLKSNSLSSLLTLFANWEQNNVEYLKNEIGHKSWNIRI